MSDQLKISSNSTGNRILGLAMFLFPLIFFVMSFSIAEMITSLEWIIAAVIAVTFAVVGIRFNFYDYDIYYQPCTNNILVKRFSQTITTIDASTFQIKSTGMLSYSFKNYELCAGGKRYNFRYFSKDRFHPFYTTADIAKNVELEIKALNRRTLA